MNEVYSMFIDGNQKFGWEAWFGGLLENKQYITFDTFCVYGQTLPTEKHTLELVHPKSILSRKTYWLWVTFINQRFWLKI